MNHIPITDPQDGKVVEWLGQVSDAECAAGCHSCPAPHHPSAYPMIQVVVIGAGSASKEPLMSQPAGAGR